MTAFVASFSITYQGAYTVGGFLRAYTTGQTGRTGLGQWHLLTDPSGFMPRLPNGGDTKFVRILQPTPRAAVQGPIVAAMLVAEYQGTGGAEIFAERTGVSGATAGDAWPRFQMASNVTGAGVPKIWFVEYGRVHSTPR